MRRTDKEYKKRLIEEIERYGNILAKAAGLIRAIDSFENDLKKITETETALQQYPEIVKINVKELTFDIRLQLEKSLDYLDRISKTGKYLYDKKE